jgi:hypothetical protein
VRSNSLDKSSYTCQVIKVEHIAKFDPIELYYVCFVCLGEE